MGSRVRASTAGRTWGVPDDLGGIEHSVPLRLREVGGHLRPMGGRGVGGRGGAHGQAESGPGGAERRVLRATGGGQVSGAVRGGGAARRARRGAARRRGGGGGGGGGAFLMMGCTDEPSTLKKDLSNASSER